MPIFLVCNLLQDSGGANLWEVSNIRTNRDHGLLPFVTVLYPWQREQVQKKTGAEILHKHHQHAIHTNSDGDRWDATAMEVAGICWDSEIEIARINWWCASTMIEGWMIGSMRWLMRKAGCVLSTAEGMRSPSLDVPYLMHRLRQGSWYMPATLAWKRCMVHDSDNRLHKVHAILFSRYMQFQPNQHPATKLLMQLLNYGRKLILLLLQKREHIVLHCP